MIGSQRSWPHALSLSTAKFRHNFQPNHQISTFHVSHNPSWPHTHPHHSESISIGTLAASIYLVQENNTFFCHTHTQDFSFHCVCVRPPNFLPAKLNRAAHTIPSITHTPHTILLCDAESSRSSKIRGFGPLPQRSPPMSSMRVSHILYIMHMSPFYLTFPTNDITCNSITCNFI